MTTTTITRKWSCLILLCFASLSANAQESFEIFSFDFSYNLSPDQDDRQFFNDINGQAVLPILLGDSFNLLLAPDVKYRYIDDVDYALPSHNLYQANMSVVLQKPLSAERSFNVVLSPGVSSDMTDISSEDIIFTGSLYWQNRKHDRLTWQYGLAFSRQADGNFAVPLFGFNWQVTKRLQLDAFDPLEPDLSLALSQDFMIGVRYHWGQNLYKLEEESGSRYVEDRRSELMPYINIAWLDHWVVKARAGYMFHRRIGLYEDVDIGTAWYNWAADPIHEDTQEGWFVEAGLALQI